MSAIRHAFNLKNPAILLGWIFAVSGLVGAIVHTNFLDEQLLMGVGFLLLGWLYELRTHAPAH